MSTPQILFWILSLLILFIFILPYFTSPLRHIPGPFAAKFTNLWRLFNNYDGRPELRHRQLHELYGPVVRLGPNCISLNNPSLIRTIYTARGEFLKSNLYAVQDVKVGKSRVHTIFSTRSNIYHASQHRLLAKYYKMANVKVFEPYVDITLQRLQTRLEQEFMNGKGDNVCKMEEWINFYGWDVIGEMTLSKPFGFLDKGGDIDGILNAADQGLDYFAVIGQMPWLDNLLDKNPIKRIGPPSFSPAANFCLKQTLNRLSGADRHEHNPEKQMDFLDYWVEIKEENPGVVGVNEIVGFLLINIIAGSDTTVATLCAIIYYIIKNPRVQHKLCAELDSSGISLPISYDDANGLPYLTAIIRESMRMHPGIGLPLERIVPEGGLKTPDGIFLPPGTIVGINPWVVHMDKVIFGQDAAVFIPERWLQYESESEEDFKSRLAAMNSADLTFGAGSRACLVSVPRVTIVADQQISFADPSMDWKLQNSWFVRQTGMDLKIKLR